MIKELVDKIKGANLPSWFKTLAIVLIFALLALGYSISLNSCSMTKTMIKSNAEGVTITTSTNGGNTSVSTTPNINVKFNSK